MKVSRIWPFLLFLLFVGIPFTHASQALEITVKTVKSTYLQGESVTISGNVILCVTPHPNSLVALWVENAGGSVMGPSITVQADEKGDFIFAFTLPKNAELGIYETYASTRIKNKNAASHTTFSVEALTQPSNGEIPEDQRILTIVMFVGVLAALGVVASAFVFLVLSRFKRDGEPPAVPREDVDERYKKCVKCGRRIFWFRAFCPYCYAYQSDIKTEKR